MIGTPTGRDAGRLLSSGEIRSNSIDEETEKPLVDERRKPLAREVAQADSSCTARSHPAAAGWSVARRKREGTPATVVQHSQARVRVGRHDGEHAAEEEGRHGEVAGELDHDAEHAEDPSSDHPADRHRDRLTK
jgi:hypothetical protein